MVQLCWCHIGGVVALYKWLQDDVMLSQVVLLGMPLLPVVVLGVPSLYFNLNSLASSSELVLSRRLIFFCRMESSRCISRWSISVLSNLRRRRRQVLYPRSVVAVSTCRNLISNYRYSPRPTTTRDLEVGYSGFLSQPDRKLLRPVL